MFKHTHDGICVEQTGSKFICYPEYNRWDCEDWIWYSATTCEEYCEEAPSEGDLSDVECEIK